MTILMKAMCCGLAICAAVTPAMGLRAQAQDAPPDPPLPAIETPVKPFKTAEDHYKYLFDKADGGTQHTMADIPVWDGLWTSGDNSMPALFLKGKATMALSFQPDAEIREGVLTPPYEQQFKERRAEVKKYGEQRYDRLTNCEYPGVPRWLWEPYVKEFVNTPGQTWMMNDVMNETRRIYIGKEHVNIDAKNSSTGDSIGFWDGDTLVIWTKWINPADYVRGMPLTSNRFEMVEKWHEEKLAEGGRELINQVTFYDPLSLTRPLSAVYTYVARPDLEKAGVRVRPWECATTSNSYRDENGDTQFRLPGDPGYKEQGGYTDFPDLPGQSLNPTYDSDGNVE